MSLLEFKDLRVSFCQDDTKVAAVRGVSFTVERGQTVALVGESGSGKSVTALSSVALLGANAVVEGSITYGGQQMVGADEKLLRRVRGNDISFIFQEPMSSLNPLHTIETQLAESLALHQGLAGGKARARILELLSLVGIDSPERRLRAWPHELSGGQRQRVMIALALANRPAVLIADEPTTALDSTIEAQVLSLLAELKTRQNMGLLFITHDLGIVQRMADHVCVMRGGRIVESGPLKAVFETPQHPYTRALLDARPAGEPPPVPDTAPELLACKNLRVWFPIRKGVLRRTVDHVKAVNDANISVRAGETLGIVGESGSGKTTLALALMRLIESSGEIRLNGRDVRRFSTRQLRASRKDVQIVFQDPYGSLSPRMTCARIIAEGLGVHGVQGGGHGGPAGAGGHSLRALVAEIMAEVGLDPATMDRYPHEFSGGQRQRIAIARAMILRPRVVMLDEPTSALDMTVQVQIVNLLRDLQSRYGLAYVFISHDLQVVRAMSHQIIVMRDSHIVEAGTAQAIFEAPQVAYTKTLLAALHP
ncbi:MAG: ABC transporter ATP-binding protein [Rhodobacteraceae bacterium]|nr:ABC transporter ATP-binding protein [Paracoccaceae bacterium]